MYIHPSKLPAKISHNPPKIKWLLEWLSKGEYSFDSGHIVAWGDTIYAKDPVIGAELAHERVHLEQQHYSKSIGLLMIIWYHISTAFRFRCELKAFQAQAVWYAEHISNRKLLHERLRNLVTQISGPLYGHMVTEDDAWNLVFPNDYLELLN